MLKNFSCFFLIFLMTSAFVGFPAYGAEKADTSIPDEAYHTRREELKARLKELA